MNKPFYVGSYRNDGLNGPNRGWIIGKFKDEPQRKNDAVEVKYWEHEAGSAKHPMKVSSIIECTFILKGKIRADINGQEVILNTGDYIVIEPGIPNNTLVEVLKDAVGLTIKAPSDPGAKKIVEESKTRL